MLSITTSFLFACCSVHVFGSSAHPLRSSLSFAGFFKDVPLPTQNDQSSAMTKSEKPVCNLISIPPQDVALKHGPKCAGSTCAGRTRDTILSAMEKYKNCVLHVPSVSSFSCDRFIQQMSTRQIHILWSPSAGLRTPVFCVQIEIGETNSISRQACSPTKV